VIPRQDTKFEVEEVMVLEMSKNFSNIFYEKPSKSCTHRQIESGHQNQEFWK